MTLFEAIESIDAPVEEVWALLSGFGSIKGWMPAVDHCSLSGDGIGAVRTVTLGQMVVRERLEVYNAQETRIAYHIEDIPGLPLRDAHANVRLEKVNDGLTRIIWRLDADKLDGPREPVTAMLQAFVKSCINGLKDAIARPSRPFM